MDNNWNNTQNHDPDDTQGNAQGGQPETSAVHTEPDMETTKLDSEERTAETYSDPNAGYSYGQQNPYSQQDPYGRQNTYGGQNSYGQYQSYNQQQNPNWGQDNYNYNVGNNTGYNRSYDTMCRNYTVLCLGIRKEWQHKPQKLLPCLFDYYRDYSGDIYYYHCNFWSGHYRLSWQCTILLK